MPQGTVAYQSILYPKGCVYSQSLGVHPDRVSIRCKPQATAIASSGTVTISYNASSITLPNCVFDSARISADVADGFLLSVVLFDRRERWRFAAPISGAYNIYRGGVQVASKKRTLRELATILLTQLGESTAVVTALSNAIYPEVRWECESPVKALDQLLTEWGFSLSLGFGVEPVRIVQLGTGATLGTMNAMLISSTIDPTIRPHWVRVCFGPSIMQARFKMEAVARETDDTWVPIDSVSYKPAAGWEQENPYRLPNVQSTVPEATYNRAITSVFRAYRIKKFAPDTLDIPDGSGTLTSIQQCLPLMNRLLDDEAIRDDGSYIPYRIYGKRFVPANSNGQPAKDITTTIDDEIVGETVQFDGETGIIIFDKPQFWIDSGQFKPAELYLEASFSIIDLTYNSPYHYEKDTVLDAAGYGYRGVVYPELEGRVVAVYGASQTVSSTSNNQTALDAIAAIITTSVASQYSTIGSQVVVYNIPLFSLRCDGAIHQIQFVISDGTQHAGSYSMASRNEEFDRFIMTRDERTAINRANLGILMDRARMSLDRRKDKADD
jgi:hypothetical protein